MFSFPHGESYKRRENRKKIEKNAAGLRLHFCYIYACVFFFL